MLLVVLLVALMLMVVVVVTWRDGRTLWSGSDRTTTPEYDHREDCSNRHAINSGEPRRPQKNRAFPPESIRRSE